MHAIEFQSILYGLIIMEILAFISIFGLCLGLKRISTWPIEFTPFFVVSSIISLLYLFGYIHILKFGTDALLFFGALLFILSPLYLKKDKNFFWKTIITPGLVIFIGFLIIFLLQAHHGFFYVWDEFSHWGPHSKLVYLNNGFLKADDVSVHPSYPLAGALFQYFFFQITGFNEKTAYIAQCFMLMSPLCIFLKNYQWKDFSKAFLSFSFIVLLLILLHLPIGLNTSLYMDAASGIYAGMLIVAYFSLPKKNSSILYLIPIVIALTLFKQKLFPFVLMATAIILINEIFENFNKRILATSIQKIGFRLLLPLVLPLASYITTTSWHLYLMKTKVPIEWKMNITFQKLKSAFLIDKTSHQIIINYVHGFSHVLEFLTVLVFLIMITFFSYKDKNKKNQLLIIQTSLFLGFIAYSFGLLLMYLFTFSVYEGITHASMDRYLNIYYLFWSVVTLFFLLDAIKQSPIKISTQFTKGLCGLILIPYVAGFIFHTKPKAAEQLRETIDPIANAVKKVTPKNAKIFSVWQKSNGLENTILIYDLIPRKFNITYFAIGKPYYKNEPWTTFLSVSQFKSQLQHYDYLLLAFSDHNFWSHYKSIFHNEKLIPFMKYSICRTNNYNSFESKNCTLHHEDVYLFKIIQKNGQLSFKNVSQYV